MKEISQLGYALLGLMHKRPQSGYDLRKIFSSTSMKTYSDSPGAIYPALRRLEEQGLILGKLDQGSGLRRRQLFRLAPAGLTALKKWIKRPITRNDLLWGQQEIILRFAFAHQVVGADAALTLLKSLEAELETYIPALHEEMRTIESVISVSARLAFEFGIRGTENLRSWTRYAIATYEKEIRGGTS